MKLEVLKRKQLRHQWGSKTKKAFEIATYNELLNNSFFRWGSWKDAQYCSNGELALAAFQLRVELKRRRRVQERGVTAANNINFKCEGGQQLDGTGMSWGSWGDWSYSCPFGICGIQTSVEKWDGPFNDDTGLNDVKFICCQ